MKPGQIVVVVSGAAWLGSAAGLLAQNGQPQEESPKPTFSAPIAVPESARAGADNRAKDDAAKAEAEARQAEEARQKPTSVTTSTVMRTDDHRYSITIFRRLGGFSLLR